MPRRRALRSQDGFTIVEVLVAIIILVVGLLGTADILLHADRSTVSSQAREGGVALQRELVEAARNIPFTQLSQASVVPTIKNMPGFTSSSVGANGWQIKRRGINYTMAIGVCAVDDPSDGTGASDPDTCADGTGGSTAAQCLAALGTTGNISGNGSAGSTQVGDCGIDLNKDGVVDNLTKGQLGTCTTALCGSGSDTNPADFLRVVTLVRWDRGDGTRYALQSTTDPYPGLSGAPRVISLTPSAGAGGAVVTTGDHIDFTATTNRKASALSWLVGGTPWGTGTDAGTGLTWTFSWQLGTPAAAAVGASPAANEVVDGTYEVGTRAYDQFNVGGQERDVTITLNRRAPYAPATFQAVNVAGNVETMWTRSPEGDIDGYRVFHQQVAGGGGDSPVCNYSTALTCIDNSAPNSGTWIYHVYAYDNTGQRQGDASLPVTIDLSDRTPTTPILLPASRSGSTVTLNWLPAADPDPGDSVVRYRIYRDGTSLADAWTTTTGLTWTDSNAADTHTYYVVAVDSKGGESAKQVTGVTL